MRTTLEVLVHITETEDGHPENVFATKIEVVGSNTMHWDLGKVGYETVKSMSKDATWHAFRDLAFERTQK
jgi:hypothetical protein